MQKDSCACASGEEMDPVGVMHSGQVLMSKPKYLQRFFASRVTFGPRRQEPEHLAFDSMARGKGLKKAKQSAEEKAQARKRR